MIKFKEFNTLEEMNNCVGTPGEYALIENEVYCYVDKDTGWQLFTSKGEQLEIQEKAYNLSKMVAAQAPNLNDEQIKTGKEKIKSIVSKFNQSKYFMLVFRDIGYFTLFTKDNMCVESIEDIVIECLQNIGEIIVVDIDDTGNAVECWVRVESGEAYVGYFFNYMDGVIRCQF